MFNFESPRQPEVNVEKEMQNGHGLEGMCERCEGEGRVRPGFLKAKKVCGDCHGKGFIKPETSETIVPYSWDTGLKH